MTPQQDVIQHLQHTDLLRFVTAGNVDDGKSTLIGRLLHDTHSIYEDHLEEVRAASARSGQAGIDLALVTDGLRSEREQRITIDVAYRHFSTQKRRFIIADTPGHEQYTRNMATGASTAHLAVILLDASRGVVTQSKRHGVIASLLGVRQAVVAVNKMDLVGYSQAAFEAIAAEYADFARRLSFRRLVFIPVSALYGDNVVHRSARMPWYEGPSLLEHLETVPLEVDAPNEFRFPVQYVLRPDSTFRGYCGTVVSGSVQVGDPVVVLPAGRLTRVRRLLGPAGECQRATAHQAITLCLEDELDVARGDLLAHPEALPWLAYELEATLIWMAAEPLRLNRPYLVKHTTNLVRGECVALLSRLDPNTLEREEANALHLNEIGQVRMRLLRPLVCDAYEHNRTTGSFILIDPVTHFTAAAGLITQVCRPQQALRLVAEGTAASRHLTAERGRVSLEDRMALLRQRPATLWLTGLSGAGKSTLAYALEQRLIASGHACVVLDGDNVRQGLNRDLGFSPQDRSENIRRVAEVARLFNEAGLIVITAFISPYREDRRQAREIVGAHRFIEAFVQAPLEECERRDPKGLYAKARAGQIPDFTGITAPYEPPEQPDLVLDTVRYSLSELVSQVWEYLVQKEIFL